MAVRLRLQRGGAKKRPFYRIVASDSRFPRDGRFIEKLGTYNPLLAKDDENRVVIKEERVQHWLSKGAQPTDRVHRLLVGKGVIDEPIRMRGTGKRAEAIAAKKAEAEAAAAEAAAAAAPAD